MLTIHDDSLLCKFWHFLYPRAMYCKANLYLKDWRLFFKWSNRNGCNVHLWPGGSSVSIPNASQDIALTDMTLGSEGLHSWNHFGSCAPIIKSMKHLFIMHFIYMFSSPENWVFMSMSFSPGPPVGLCMCAGQICSSPTCHIGAINLACSSRLWYCCWNVLWKDFMVFSCKDSFGTDWKSSSTDSQDVPVFL